MLALQPHQHLGFRRRVRRHPRRRATASARSVIARRTSGSAPQPRQKARRAPPPRTSEPPARRGAGPTSRGPCASAPAPGHRPRPPSSPSPRHRRHRQRLGKSLGVLRALGAAAAARPRNRKRYATPPGFRSPSALFTRMMSAISMIPRFTPCNSVAARGGPAASNEDIAHLGHHGFPTDPRPPSRSAPRRSPRPRTAPPPRGSGG